MNENEVLLEGQELAVANASRGLTGGQKTAIIVGAIVLTLGTGVVAYKLVKFFKARKAAKANSQPEETHE